MDVFVGFLVAGLIIIAVLMGAFTVTDIEFAAPQENITNITNKTNITKTTQFVVTEGFVGPVNKEIWRTIDFGEFDTSYLSNKTTFEVRGKELKNGLLFGSNEIIYNYKLPEDYLGTTINFEITETNRYAPLLVTVNDNIITQKIYPIGRYKVHVNNSFLQKNNTIEIKPMSSLWKLWAPAYYDIKNVKTVSQSLFLKSEDYKFNVYENEIKKFTKGWLNVDTDKRKGTFIYEINGKKQFEGQLTKSSEKLTFDKSDLILGENTLTIKSGKNAKFSGEAHLVIYHISPKNYKITKPFNISKSDYKDLVEGTITFTIKEKIADGGIKVSLNNERVCYSSVSCYPNVEENRKYTFTFDKDKAKQGNNILKVESIDNSAFVVEDLRKTVS